jgi:predicted methyltransferase
MIFHIALGMLAALCVGLGAETLHRIDPAQVKAEALAAGFVLVGESQLLRNPADDHSKRVFDSSIRGVTDQFILKFQKPGGRTR